jgi:tetratricopeptide (TPR) repeat protein
MKVARQATRQAEPLAQDLGGEQILEQIMADPRQAAIAAERALVDARARSDGAGQASALRALGLAAHVLHDPPAADAYLTQAIRYARQAAATVIEAEARMSHALVLDDLGNPGAALREIDRACAQLSGLRLARAMMQRALILRRVGRDNDALVGYQRALTAFRRHGDALWQGRVLVNRGVLRGYRGELPAARADLEEAVRIFTQLNLATAVAQAQHNLGFLAAQAGDVTTALGYYDLAREQLSYIGAAAVTQLDLAELLLAARLLPEARLAVAQAIQAARVGQFRSLLGQAQLLSARIELTSGAGSDARAIAARARATFVRQGRPTWAVLAHRVEIAARVTAGGGDRRAVRALELAGDKLSAARWLPAAWDAWIDAAHLAVDVGAAPAAARCLDKAAAARTSGPAPLRARARHAQALIAIRAGDVAAAKQHAAAGYRDIEAHQASLGATELGLRSSTAGVEIAALRLRLSLREGNPRDALRWLQRVRSAALRLPAARPADDPELAARLSELRAIGGEIMTTAIDSPRMQRLLRRQRSVEADIRQRSWRVAGAAAAGPARQPQLSELAAALGQRALVEVFALDGDLHAIIMVDGRIRHRRLSTVHEVTDELAALRFAIRRRMIHARDAAAAARAAEAVRYSADRLERVLLDPITDLIGDRPLVLAPTGVLHGLPWSMLAGCRGRPVTVSPSSWQWWRATRQPAVDSGRVLVGAPAPRHAAAEVAWLHTQMPDALALTGTEATVSRTLAALDGTRTGHIACHGVFRADNPMFSQLMLADGPLTVCDLSGLRRAPTLLILSSCDAGLSAVHPGDELQGLAAALLGLGTRTVIAGLGPVDDEATLHLMAGLHQRLGAGTPPAQALAEAQAAVGAEHAVSAASFVCLGAG